MKDNDYNARFIFIGPPEPAELERRLKQKGAESEEKIEERINMAKQEFEEAKVEGVHDKVLVNGDLGSTLEELENYVFGRGETGDPTSTEGVENTSGAENEAEMTDDNAAARDSSREAAATTAMETDGAAPEAAPTEDTIK